jgi:hypothetical protein
MTNEEKHELIEISEIELIPLLEQQGAKVVRKSPTEIAFLIKDMKLAIYLDRYFEVYGNVSSLKTKQSVSFSELLSDYLNVQDSASYQLSERFPMKSCLKKFSNLIISRILPLIIDGRIDAAISLVMLKREERLRLYVYIMIL